MRLALCVAIISSVLLISLPVSAQQVSISLEPAVVRLATEPGRSLFVDLEIFNQGDPGIFILTPYTVYETDREGNALIAPYDNQEIDISSVGSDFKLEQPTFLRSGQRESTRLQFFVPGDLPNGEYRFAVVAANSPQQEEDGSVTALISAGVGSIISIQVTDDNRDQKYIDLVFFDTAIGRGDRVMGSDLAIVGSGDPIPLVLSIRNNGVFGQELNGHLRIRGTMVPEETIPLKQGIIPPQTEYIAEAADYSRNLCADRMSPERCTRPYTTILSGMPFGLYHVTARTSIAGGSIESFSHQYILVLPFMLLGISLLLLALVCGIVLREYLRHRRAEEKMRIVRTRKSG